MKQFLLRVRQTKGDSPDFLRVEAFRLMETLNENFHFSLPTLFGKTQKKLKESFRLSVAIYFKGIYSGN